MVGEFLFYLIHALNVVYVAITRLKIMTTADQEIMFCKTIKGPEMKSSSSLFGKLITQFQT